ncbi:hypothetical protein WJX75_001591 [Coccomyxa subellipsoidea]|uniref:Acyltransferase n=1 Tax=Coccomyxa subellipsoidea TaxID=248742 RepID=A0ABR2YP63_9CHLO
MLLCFGFVSIFPVVLLACTAALFLSHSRGAAVVIVITIAAAFLPLGKMWPAFRHSFLFDTWRRYFRMRIITPLQPFMDHSRRYLCVQFPHAAFPMGCWLNPAIVGLPGSGMPGPWEGVVASIMLQLPFIRHMFAWIGAHPADRETLAALLKRTSVGMQPEGIAGIFNGATPEREAVFLSQRKGFVRVAIQAGADILPVYHIGNSQMFSFWGPKSLSRWLRVSVGIFWGRFGLPLPRRHDIISLLGRPIPVRQADHPTAEEVDEVKVVSRNFDLPSSECPFDIECHSKTQQVWEIALPWPELPESATELLDWFSSLLEECTPCQAEQEGSTPGLAEQFEGPCKLTAVSEGAGDGRFLKVIQKSAQRERRTVSEKTRQIWKWCQDEGGASWGVSQGEIEDLLASDKPLPSNIQSVIDDRHRSAQLLDSIEEKDEARAVSIIEDNRKAAWLRNESSGNYPIHEAINQDLALLVGRLSVMPGVLQQRDAKYRVPLVLAQQLRRQGLVEILTWAAG